MANKLPCVGCGTPRWTTKGKPVRCHECRRQGGPGWSPRRPCAWCGTDFVGKRPTARFCSLACSGKADSARRRAKREAVTAHSRRVDREAHAVGLSRDARRRMLKRWRQQRRRCWYCTRIATTVDHLIPLVRGGTNYEGNLVPACLSCNSRKQDRLPIEFRLGKRASSTYQPFRERSRAEPKPKPVKVKPLRPCVVCGHSGERRTCSRACAVEWNARQNRERYRARAGLPPTWDVPTKPRVDRDAA